MRVCFICFVISLLLYSTESRAEYEGNIFKVIANSDVVEFKKAIKQGVNLNQKNAQQEDPFEYAILHFKNPLILKMLIKEISSFNTPLGRSGKSVLLTALKRYPDAEIIETLLQKEAKVTDVDEKGNGSLVYAYHFFPEPSILEMLMNKDVPVDQKDDKGRTVLQLAVLDGKRRLVETLLEYGANMNVLYDDGKTLLQKAIETENEDVVRLLLDFGADIYPANIKDKTLLMLAVRDGKKERIAKMLMEAGISVQERDADGKTALMYAAESQKNPAVFDLLLKEGAYAYTQDKQGTTAVDYLEKNKELQKKPAVYKKIRNMFDSSEYLPDFFELVKYGTVVEVLQAVKEGADVNEPDPSGLQPVFLAAQYALGSGIFDILIRSGANLDVRDKGGRTPLFYAVIARNMIVLNALLEKKVDVNATDNQGDTALIYISQYAQSPFDMHFAQKLIDAGAKVNVRNISGKSALMAAAEFNSFPDMIVLLLVNGAKSSYKTALGQTAVDLADENLRLASRPDYKEIKEALIHGRVTKKYHQSIHPNH